MQQAASRRVDKVLKPEGSDAEDAELIVLGSGNLGLVYVPGPERLLLEEIEARWPALMPGLVAHPGIGFVSALSATGPVAIGEHGRHDLVDRRGRGRRPAAHVRGPRAGDAARPPR